MIAAQPSLARVLMRQWVAFGLALFAVFAAVSLLMLFVLEDSFIDTRLREVAGSIAAAPAPALPQGFSLQALDMAGDELRRAVHGLDPGAIRELRLADGRYVHVLRGRAPSGDDYLLAYDVSDQLRVNQAIGRAGPWLAGMAAVLVLVAGGLARAFAARIGRQAEALVARIGDSPDVESLRACADAQAIREFGQLARLAAESWQSRLQALDAERETLAFLGHELRTPLQSARTSLALLEDDRSDAAAWQRLRRAQTRLARASNSVLWLAREPAPEPPATCDVPALVRQLLQEFEPLAAGRGQRLHGAPPDGLQWALPMDVAETVLANLLLNAIQHGGPGVVEVHADDNGLTMVNPPGAEPALAGFGLGLRLSQRLLERFGWRLQHDRPPGRNVATRVLAPGARA
jgi:signal transduction histidine kinase